MTSHPPPGVGARHSTRLAFLIGGLTMASWAPLVPYAKERAALSEGALGLLLLCLGIGSILAMPLAGILCSRLGCRTVITLGAASAIAALPLLATLSNGPLLALALLLFGAGVGSLDVSMNVQAIFVERASGRAMMSGFHGLFSLGGFAGALGVTALLENGFSPAAAALAISGLCTVALLGAFPFLLPYGSRNDGPFFSIPRGYVLLLGAICFIAFMAEGSVLDWSAVFLTSVHGIEKTRAGLGYTAFAVTMTLGRLSGDRLVDQFGSVRVTLAGALLSALGLLIATGIPSWKVALLGYAILGIGCSNLAPIMFSLVGKQQEMPESFAVPAITTLGYAGILLGPALIGFLSHLFGLPVAFLAVALMLVGVASVSGRLRT